MVVALGYNFTLYLFIGCKFWQIHYWIMFFSYILYEEFCYKVVNARLWVMKTTKRFTERIQWIRRTEREREREGERIETEKISS